MSLLHHKPKAADEPAATTAHDVGPADYDAAADLALPTSDTATTTPDDGFTPFAGELADQHQDPGYDVLRDTGIMPG